MSDDTRGRPRERVETMNLRERIALGLVLAAVLAGCAPLTAEQLAELEEQQRRQAAECSLRGGWYVSGSCVSRGGGA